MQQHSRLAALSLFPDGHFRLIRDLETQVQQEKASAGIIRAQEEQLQDANEPAAPTPMPTTGKQPRI